MAVAMQIIHQPKRRIEIPMEEGSPENQPRVVDKVVALVFTELLDAKTNCMF